MRIRPLAATVGTLLGVSTLFFPATVAQAIDHPHRPVVVAHRGASAYAPENTLAAVDKADDLGITWVENDVQRTKDGELAVIHDTDLKRTTNVEQVFPDRAPWKVADFTMAEIKRLDAGSWFSPAYAGERVPTLEEYLERVSDHRQKLLLEIKAPELYPGLELQTLRELRREGWLDRSHVRRKLIIQSFSADSVGMVHKLRPDIKTGFLGAPEVADLKTYAQFVDQINPSHRTLTPEYVAAVHKLRGAHGRRLEVFTWTVNDGPRAALLKSYGVDGIITNTPDIVRDATARSTSDHSAFAGASAS
ncbi:glycerophosphodiester phosphodiesterase family protein [Streptomyces sp. NPDC002055]|uniref:glycerophosphodiester phosphodiesterase n=1 Tax=Streptomyces sp. NPDC002055 TaxID=3154534 RepID=UPI0033271D7F